MKKSIFYSILTLAALITLAACQKESFNQEESAKKGTVIGVGIFNPSDLKTTIGPVDEDNNRPIYWANGDAINVNGYNSEPLSDVEENRDRAFFTFTDDLEYPYNLLYPAEYYKEGNIDFPSLQNFTPIVPMCAYAENAEAKITMIPATAVLKLPVVLKAGGDVNTKLKTLVVKAANGNLCGEFSINYATGELTAVEGDKTMKVLVNKNINETTPVDIYAVIPPASNETYIIRVVDTNGECISIKLTDKTFAAGVVYGLNTLEYEPKGIAADYEIESAEQWNLYAESFNAAPEDHQTDVVSIVGVLDFTGTTNTPIGEHYGSDIYFSGSVIGNNQTIKNLESSTPLFGCVNSSASITGLTIDESCSFTVPYSTINYFGPFAEYVKGKIENCHNKASITLAADESGESENTVYVGGLAGRVREGKLISCSNSGNITLDATYKGKTNKIYTYAGGIVGYMSNAAAVVDDCSNSGKITTAALTNTTVLAGIGANVSGTISNCENTGEITSSMARPGSDACKFIKIGGIAGTVNDNVTLRDNSNKVDITVSDAVKQNFIGGIAAQIAGSRTTLSGNTNSGNISSTAGIRNAYFGGLYGQVSATTSITLTGSPFTGKISISGHESVGSAYLFAGGIVGLSIAELTITGDNCTLESDITIPQSSSTAVELFMGGVVGAAGENGGGTVESGAKVTVSGISVSGKIKMTGSDNTIVPLYQKAAFGGILGAAFAGADISNCESTTDVYFCEAATAGGSNGNPAHLGGIAGRIEGANSKISNCTAGGNVYSYLYNNNWWNANDQVGINAVGGIVGSFGYNKGQTYTLVLSDCSSSATCYGYRGTVGGIAGYLDKATLSGTNSFTFTGSIIRGAPAAGVAGIANECAISGCTVKSSKIAGSSAGSCIGHAAGIVGLGMSTRVNGCKSFVSALTATGNTAGFVAGGIIACPDSKCSIDNCSYGGKVGNNTISNDNVGLYVIGNEEITPSNVTRWDGK